MKKYNKIVKFSILASSFALLLTGLSNPKLVFAKKDIDSFFENPILGNTLKSLTGGKFISNLIVALINLGLIIGAVVFFFMLVIGGISWITSGGNKAALESARGRITHAIIGIAVLLSIFAVINLVEYFFDTNLRQFNIGPLNIGGVPLPEGNGD